MANTAKVKIEATYQDRTKKGLNQTEKNVALLKRGVVALAGAWGTREAAAFVHEITKLAAQVEITEGAFRKLTDKAGRDFVQVLGQMRTAVGGTLSDLELMQRVGAAVDAGLTFDQAIIALQFLRRYSLAFGKDFNQLVATIFTGLQRGSVLFLDDAGIILSASDKMFDGLNDIEKKSALVGEAIRLMTQKMDTLPEITSNAVTESDKLGAAWEQIKINLGESLAPLASVTSVLGDMAQALAEVTAQGETFARGEALFNSAENVLARLKEERESLIAALADPGGREAASGRASETAGLLREDRLKAVNEYIAILEKEQRIEQENAALTAKALENGKRLMEERKKAAEEAAAANEKYLETLMAKNAAEIHAGQVARRESEEATARAQEELDAQADADAARFTNRQTVVDAIRDLEVQASDDLVKIRQHALRVEARAEVLRLKALGATAEEIQRVIDLYKELIDQVGEGGRDDQLAKQFRLVFAADFTAIENTSDIALFGLGKVLNALESIAPSAANAGKSLVGMFQALQQGGPAGAVGAAFAGLNLVMGVFGGRSRYAEAELRRLNEQIRAAAEASGEFAQGLEERTLRDIARQWTTNLGHIQGIIGRDIPAELQTFFGFNMPRLLREGFGADQQAYAYLLELERIAEFMRGHNGEIRDFGDALSVFNHAVAVEGLSDPTDRLERLAGILGSLGINIRDGLDDQELSNLTSSQGRRLIEMIAGLQRDITQFELDERRANADLLVEGIRENAAAVRDALKDEEEAAKRAALRAVGLQFDIQEQALRSQFFPQLKGAGGDPFETQRIILEAQQEIALLQLSEQSAMSAALDDIRSQFDAAEQAADQTTQELIDATYAAAEDLSDSFDNSLARWIGTLDFTAFLTASEALGTEQGITSDVLVEIQNDLLSSQGIIAAAATQTVTEIENVVAAVNAIEVAPTVAFAGITESLFLTQTERLILATNNPTWAAGGLGGGGTNLSFTVEVDARVTGGGSSGLDADDVEDIVADSLVNGRVGARLGEMLRALGIDTRPNIPSSIRI